MKTTDILGTARNLSPKEYISSGSFSKVYKVGDDKVIKCMITERNISTIKYLKYCKKNHEINPFLPKVYAVKADGEITYVLMEKLEHDYNFVRDFTDKHFEYTKFLHQQNSRKFINLPWHALIKYLNRLNRIHHGKFDLHNANFMVRGTQIVFTDPIFDPKYV